MVMLTCMFMHRVLEFFNFFSLNSENRYEQLQLCEIRPPIHVFLIPFTTQTFHLLHIVPKPKKHLLFIIKLNLLLEMKPVQKHK